MSGSSRTQRTYRLELQRAAANGVLESAGHTFLLLVAVRWFEAGATAKALVASGGFAGLLLTPAIVSTVARLGWPVAQAAQHLAAIGAVTFVLMAIFPSLPLYVAGSVLTMAAVSTAVPLMTQVYQENYPATQRGRLFAHAVMVRIGTVAVFSAFAGKFLDADMARFRWLLLIFAGAFVFAWDRFRRYPSNRLADDGGSHPFRAMRFVQTDGRFRHVLICWMLMGFANLMMLPMRVEYLANPISGLGLDVASVALFTSVLPNAVRLLMSQVWGRLFDRLNFFALRAGLNLVFAVGIFTFFHSDTTAGLAVGAIVLGVASAGGDVAWGLWVTKFAPPGRVADYMSVHTFFTGVRGVIGPLTAFHLANRVSLRSLAGASVVLILISALMLLSRLPEGRRLHSGRAWTEDISD